MRKLFPGLIVLLLLPNLLQAAERPNVLWITSEDNGPQLGCYGDEYAITPNLDALAEKGCRYEHCWSNAPVCAPARTTLITGMFPTSLGAQHMRSSLPIPEGIKLYPQYLRDAGYYCTNNSKEDYNLSSVGKIWDESSRKAHWKNRGEKQPFFAIFNHTISHESQIRNKIDDKNRIHDPAKVRVPAYHPDTPEVRKDWAQYYDRMTMMDALVGKNLKELEEAGVAEDTIVFYYGDHGSGMPRSKRFPYNSGLHVPLIVYIPAKWQHLATSDYQQGKASSRLTSFVDLTPTLLSVCGLKPPEHMQGFAFLGKFATEPKPYIYGYRGRMDERIDMMRSITDGRYIYIRNYYPHRPYGQYVNYMFQTPTTRVWHDMFKAGKLNKAQSHFWQRKPLEELYDLKTDPDEVKNLADSAEHKAIKEKLQDALIDHQVAIKDLGFQPEYRANTYGGPKSPYDRARFGERDLYNTRALHHTAVTCLDPENAPDNLTIYFEQAGRFAPYEDVALFWAATGILANGGEHFQMHRGKLRDIIAGKHDLANSSTEIAAAEALATHGDADDVAAALPVLVKYANVQEKGVFNAIQALNALDYLDEKARPVRDEIAKLPKNAKNVPGRMGSYVTRLLEKTLGDLKP